MMYATPAAHWKEALVGRKHPALLRLGRKSGRFFIEMSPTGQRYSLIAPSFARTPVGDQGLRDTSDQWIPSAVKLPQIRSVSSD